MNQDPGLVIPINYQLAVIKQQQPSVVLEKNNVCTAGNVLPS